MSFLRKKGGDTLIEVMFAVGIFSLIAIAVVTTMNSGTSSIQGALESTMARNEIDTQAEALRYIHSSYIAEKDAAATKKTDSTGTYTKIWQDIISRANEPNDINNYSNQDSTNSTSSFCELLYSKNDTEIANGKTIKNIYNQKAFILNTRALDDPDKAVVAANVGNTIFKRALIHPRILYKNENDNTLLQEQLSTEIDSVEGIYIIAVKDAQKTTLVQNNNSPVTQGTAYYDFYIQTCWDKTNTNSASNTSTVIRLYDPNMQVVNNQMISFSLIFDANGGSTTPPPKSINVKNTQTTFTLNNDDKTSKSNNKFLGWADENYTSSKDQCAHAIMPNSKASAITVKSDNPIKTVKALWQCTYTLNYNKNANSGVTNVSGIPNSNSITTDESTYNIKIATAEPTRSEWTFYGWSTNPNADPAKPNSTGGNHIYNPGDNGPTLGVNWTGYSQEATLYAIWGHTYTLSYNKNTACSNIKNMPSNKSVTTSQHGTYKMAIEGEPTCEGYKFFGWSTNKSAKTNDSLLKAGDQAIFDYTKGSDTITLYGIWIKDSRDTAFALDLTGSMSSFISDNSSTIRNLVKTVLDGGYRTAVYNYGYTGSATRSWCQDSNYEIQNYSKRDCTKYGYSWQSMKIPESGSSYARICGFEINTCTLGNIGFLKNIPSSGHTENVYTTLLGIMNDENWVSGATNTIIVLTDETGNDNDAEMINRVIAKAREIDEVNVYVFYDGDPGEAYKKVTSDTHGEVLRSTDELEELIEELKKRK